MPPLGREGKILGAVHGPTGLDVERGDEPAPVMDRVLQPECAAVELHCEPPHLPAEIVGKSVRRSDDRRLVQAAGQFEVARGPAVLGTTVGGKLADR
jgi:hypothetical protein